MCITVRLARVPPLPEQTAAVRRDFGYEARAVARPGGRARNEGEEAVQGRRRRLGRPRGRLGPRAGARAARRDAAGAQSCETCAPARAPAGAVRAAAVGGRRDARAVRRGRAALAARDDGDAAAAALGDAFASVSLFYRESARRRRLRASSFSRAAVLSPRLRRARWCRGSTPSTRCSMAWRFTEGSRKNQDNPTHCSMSTQAPARAGPRPRGPRRGGLLRRKHRHQSPRRRRGRPPSTRATPGTRTTTSTTSWATAGTTSRRRERRPSRRRRGRCRR